MKILPFYTSTGMRDAERVNSHDALLCPDYKFLPFQIQRAAYQSTGLTTAVLVDCAGAETNIFSYLELETIEKTTYDFMTYNGMMLGTALTRNVYSLKVGDGMTTWYSEWFSMQNIQPQLITGYSTSTYDTFTNSGANITSAIQAAGNAYAPTNTFSIRTGEKFIVTGDLTRNAGTIFPFARLYVGGSIASNIDAFVIGKNNLELTATMSGTAEIRIITGGAINFEIDWLSLRRKAGDYVHLEFTNARDINNTDHSILYTSPVGFIQQAYLRAYENLPSHEVIEFGGDKNGEFVVEKEVRKYTRSVISYESRSMYNALTLLKLHSSVKILDEAGVEFTPSVGNVNVTIDWNTFDTGTLKLAWNEAGEVWTNSSDNIT